MSGARSQPVCDPAADGWKPRVLPGFFGLVGPLWTRREGDAWAYAFLAEARHTNPAGVVHGGMLTTLVDHALSTIAWEANQRQPCMTIQLDMQFVGSVRPGQLVVARGHIVRQTGSLIFMRGSLSIEDSEVAVASMILKCVAPSAPNPAPRTP